MLIGVRFVCSPSCAFGSLIFVSCVQGMLLDSSGLVEFYSNIAILRGFAGAFLFCLKGVRTLLKLNLCRGVNANQKRKVFFTEMSMRVFPWCAFALALYQS